MFAQPSEIDEKQLDFIYQSGVKTLDGTLEAMKGISNRSIVILSYISLVIGFCVNNMFQKHIPCFYLLILTIFTIYYICIFTYIIDFAKPRKAAFPYDDPKTLLDKECICEDEHVLKYITCKVLQVKIDENRNMVLQMNAKFNKALNLAFLFIPYLFIRFWRKAVPLS